MQDKIQIEWIEDGGDVRGYGRRVKGKKITVPADLAKDVIGKKWAKKVKTKTDTEQEG